MQILLIVLTFLIGKNYGDIIVGLLSPSDQLPDSNLVCNLAINNAKAAGNCASTIRYINDTGCDVTLNVAIGSIRGAEMVKRKNATALIPAAYCALETYDLTRLSYYWGIPVVARYGNDYKVFDNNFNPHILKIPESNIIAITYTLYKFMLMTKQANLTILSPNPTKDTERPSLSIGMQKYLNYLEAQNLYTYTGMNRFQFIDESQISSNIENIMKELQTRLIVFDSGFKNLKNVMDTLGVTTLTTSDNQKEFMIAIICSTSVAKCLGTADTKTAVYKGLIVMIAPYVPNEVSVKSYFNTSILGHDMTNIYSSLLEYYIVYNACYGFCYGTKLYGGNSNLVGTTFINNLRAQSVSTNIGTVDFDQNAVILPSYSISWYQQATDPANDNLTYIQAIPSRIACSTIELRCFDLTFTRNTVDIWNGSIANGTLQYCAVSKCTSGGDNNWIIIVVVVIVILIILGLGGFYLYFRQQRLNIYRLHWKIPRHDVKIIENKQKGKGTQAGDTLANKRRAIQAYAIIGTSKAEFISLKQLRRVRWEKEELKFIFELKRLTHDNLTSFHGMSYNDDEHFFVFYNLVDRASLEDFVNDHDFVMDATFKSAFLKDILKGIQYLHKSPVGYHGLLNLQNCLIDANWVLKLTNFGITNLLNRVIETEHLKVIEIIPLQTYLTVAPEHLTDVALGKMYPKGSPQGDIYSFGMILYQILFRYGPYERTNLTIKEILEEIRKRGLKPIVENTPPEERTLVEAMNQCWNQNPELRPKLRNLSQIISSAFEASKGNLVDQMIRMNEKYAMNLERIVAERNSMLVEAQEQTDRLLTSMLPPSIAEQLKAGQTINPRGYDSVTVMFVQICDFIIFLNKSLPDQVVSFLNDVFSMFDEIIGKHDAYKVETTGDTYMVASGVPNENEHRHVFEISEVALEYREVCYTYKVPWNPEWKLQVKIGYHCGPIAAGVIGLKAPRYCLFGDTVNFASRMQSNCPPNQIQMSESTAKMLMERAEYKLTKRGIVKVKGKGDVNTYWLNEYIHDHEKEHAEVKKTPNEVERKKSA